MLKPALVLFVVVSVMSAAALSDVVLTGTATDCFESSRYTVEDVNVAAFDPADNQTMVNLLRTMDTVTFPESDPNASGRFESLYVQMIDLVNTSAALDRDTSTATGFTLRVAAMDSIVVVGHKVREDEIFYATYKMVGGQANSHVVLDMSSGGCNYLP